MEHMLVDITFPFGITRATGTVYVDLSFAHILFG